MSGQKIIDALNKAIDDLLVMGVRIDYTNWRGERAVRSIRPVALAFKSTDWHPEPQWLLRAYDVERGQVREFAMKDVHSWLPSPPLAQTGESD